MNVLDLFGGNKYWAEIMAPAVGPKGHVTVWEPTQFFADAEPRPSTTSRRSTPNVRSSQRRSKRRTAEELADFVILNDNYHDTYWRSAKYEIPQMDPAAFLKAVYAAMKPGAVIGVIDHVANPNEDARATVEKYHRIDPR